MVVTSQAIQRKVKLKTQVLSYTSYISSAQYPLVATGYHTGQLRYRTFPSAQKVLPDSADEEKHRRLWWWGKQWYPTGSKFLPHPYQAGRLWRIFNYSPNFDSMSIGARSPQVPVLVPNPCFQPSHFEIRSWKLWMAVGQKDLAALMVNSLFTLQLLGLRAKRHGLC